MDAYHIFGYELSLLQLAVIVAVAFVSGFSKSGIIGLGVIVTPVMAAVFSAGQSLGFMVPLYIIGDVTAILYTRRRREVMWRPLLKALPWGVVGIFAGWRLAAFLADAFGPEADYYLRKLIGVLMAAVVGLSYYVSRHPEIAMRQAADGADSGGVRIWYAALLGSFAGMVSMLTNSAGSIWALYFTSLGFGVREIVGTAIWCFFATSVLKLPLSANLGFLDGNSLRFNLVLAPLAIAGVLAGYKISNRFSKRTFALIIQSLATAGSLYMILS